MSVHLEDIRSSRGHRHPLTWVHTWPAPSLDCAWRTMGGTTSLPPPYRSTGSPATGGAPAHCNSRQSRISQCTSSSHSHSFKSPVIHPFASYQECFVSSCDVL